jgi:hypothetical protein
VHVWHGAEFDRANAQAHHDHQHGGGEHHGSHPLANIPSFGACTSLANPTMAAATAAALGVLTPTPCIPITPAPWVPGSPTVTLQNFPALNESSKLMCMWAGVISITFAGQVTEFIP